MVGVHTVHDAHLDVDHVDAQVCVGGELLGKGAACAGLRAIQHEQARGGGYLRLAGWSCARKRDVLLRGTSSRVCTCKSSNERGWESPKCP